MKKRFSTFDITKALGIPRERLKDWMNNGFIVPTEPAHGKGTKAGFTITDIYGVALFQDLIEKGLKREIAATFVKHFIKGENIEKTDHILFRYERRGGHIEIRSMTVETGPWAIDLETGAIGFHDRKGRVPFRPFDPRELRGEKIDYNHLHIVKFRKLRERVNQALVALP
jgi:hypothetical protein